MSNVKIEITIKNLANKENTEFQERTLEYTKVGDYAIIKEDELEWIGQRANDLVHEVDKLRENQQEKKEVDEKSDESNDNESNDEPDELLIPYYDTKNDVFVTYEDLVKCTKKYEKIEEELKQLKDENNLYHTMISKLSKENNTPPSNNCDLCHQKYSTKSALKLHLTTAKHQEKEREKERKKGNKRL